MVAITIDGKEMQVDEEQNVLECALNANIYIPHLCHHADLEDIGACRMCLVEVDGEKEPVTSCTLTPKEGMVIRTESETIQQLRRLALELILAGHPEECTTCPKYGNCELQTLIQYIGPNTGRMHMRSKGFPVEEGNPMFIHDMNRCVLCGRCVRACQELRGVNVLHYKKKDMEAYVGTLHDDLLTNEACRFCGACAEVCPTGTIRDKLQALEGTIRKEDAIVACKYHCPAHTDVPRYIRYAKEGKFEEAEAVIRENVPFPMILGYICNHVCEANCHRGEVNEPISIRNIKRYIAEHSEGKLWRRHVKQLETTGKKVCVVGSGPAGLSAAYYLRKQGHDVLVKEKLTEIGGMMRFGIPEYRLPKDVIEKEVHVILETGVQVETGAEVTDPLELLNDFDAVLMTVGSHQGIKLNMEGKDLKGVQVNLDFLRKARMYEDTGIGNRVVVLGGGNVAFDCARTAKRLGAKDVYVACLESRETMTADDEEINGATEEGIHIHPGRTFEKILGTTSVEGVSFMQVETFEFDDQGRPVITKKENSEEYIEADTVIFAVGQVPIIPEDWKLPMNRRLLKVEEGTTFTGIEGVYAAGDVIYGTNSVVKAIASGKEAASEIDRYLGGDGDIREKLAPEQFKNPYIGRNEAFPALKRSSTTHKTCACIENNFELVDQGLEESALTAETNRCLQCDLRLEISEARLWGDYKDSKGEVL